MNTLLRRLSTTALVTPLLLVGGLAAHAEGPDVSAPVAVDYSVTSDDGDDDLTFFIEHEPATFTVRVHITDQTGLDRSSGLFNPPNPVITVSSEETDQSVGFGGMTLVSGDEKDGWYEKTVTIPEGQAPGDWKVTLYPLEDTLGNSSGLSDFEFFGTLGVVDIVYGAPAVPAAVTFDDAASSYTIPDTEGVEYLVDGDVVEAGTHSATGVVTVTAQALDGYVVDGDSSWSHTFVATSATAAAVTFQDEDGATADTYTVPSVTGVEYLVDGTVVKAGTHAGTGTVKVTARALDGYELTGTSTWSHTFDGTTAVTAEPVTFIDQSGTARDTYTIPSAKGVEYVVSGKVVKAGTHAGTGTVKVTARALDGYELTGTTTWSTAFTAKTPFIDVKPGVEHYDAMMWMYDAGVSTGWKTSKGPEYRALAPVNRDAMAAFLYRQAGSPEVTLPAQSPFTDMHPGKEHYTAVIWAYQEGITEGWTMPDGTHQFRPVQPIARDAMAAFMFRFAGEPAYTQPSAACFTDVPHGMKFSKEMCWMKDTGLSNGWRDGTYRPLSPVNRDAMAAFLQRYDANF